MRKYIFVFALLFVSFFLMASPSFALLCKEGQGLDKSDECWTAVRIPSNLTYVVSVGSVLVHDFTNADSAELASVMGTTSTASLDTYNVIGVAQSVIATGDTGMVLVRGKGKVLAIGVTASGDRLFTSTTRGNVGTGVPRVANANMDTQTSGDPIAISLQTRTTGTTGTIDAYIKGIL